jgi:hypothetical protein
MVERSMGCENDYVTRSMNEISQDKIKTLLSFDFQITFGGQGLRF